MDDLGDSAESLTVLKQVVSEADELFQQVGLSCKGWSFSGSSPPVEVCEEGELVSIGGMKWVTKLDLLEVPIPSLHFSKKVRGRLAVGTEVFNGSFADLENFVPKKLTRTMIFSKNNSLFDILGKFVPVTAGFKLDLRKAVQLTEGWNDPVPEELRSKWLHNFWKMESLRGIKFERARMPPDAISPDMDLIAAGDAAEYVKIVGVWGRFRLKSGKFSCQLLIGRSLLAAEDATIPKSELDVLMMTSNLCWIVQLALEKWVKSYIAIGDSTISLCWVISEKKRLSLYHRNRTVQIRRGINIENLYHVVSEENPADCGTRPSHVTMDQVGPNSNWERGLGWMKEEIDDAVAAGTLTPASNLRIKEEDEEAYKDGFVFERSQEILTRGHTVVNLTRVDQVKMRAEEAKYILLPTKFKFLKTVRVVAVVFKFLKSFKCLRKRFNSDADNPKFNMFPVQSTVSQGFRNLHAMTPVISYVNTHGLQKVQKVFDKRYVRDNLEDSVGDCVDIMRISPEGFNGYTNRICCGRRITAISHGVKQPGLTFSGKLHIVLSEEDISSSLEYFYRKETELLMKFNKSEFLKKISVLKNGILFSRSRIIDGQRFQEAGYMENMDSFRSYNLKLMTPLIDRFSPFAYSVGDYIHEKIMQHSGYERCYRESLNHCFIVHGLSLFREICDDCVNCKKIRKKYIEASLGPVADEQLTVAPAFYVTMADIYGPCQIYVPGHTMKTRHRNILEAKCYVLVFCCPVTKAVNLQVIEAKSADAVLDGVNRLGCEVGFPKIILIDQDTGIMKALKEAQVNLFDLEAVLYKTRSVQFKTCPVSGHNYHGLVERKIRSVSECLDQSGFSKLKYHATGLQTVLKLIENDLNNQPLGYSYGRDSDNSPILRLIFPNMLKVGRLNRRSLDGPVKFPQNPGELMSKITKGYDAFFKLWNTSMIPKLMKQTKWYKSNENISEHDIVYFQKVESEWNSKWTVGKVIDTVKSKDGIVRRALVEYRNSNEEESRTTDRSVRSLIKLFHIDDEDWQSDMVKVEKLLATFSSNPSSSVCSSTGSSQACSVSLDTAVLGNKLSLWLAKKKCCGVCCCSSHCSLFEHEGGDVVLSSCDVMESDFKGLLDKSWISYQDYEDSVCPEPSYRDPFLSLVCALNTDMAYAEGDLLGSN